MVFYDVVATGWINIYGGNCNGVGCHLEGMPGLEYSASANSSFGDNYQTNSGGDSCSEDEKMPSGPSNHDFNKHLRSVHRLSDSIDALNSNFLSSNIIKHGLLFSHFQTNGPWDLKNNDAYAGASPDYGNFWYGAVLAAMGYSESYALYAGAVYQDIDDAGGFSELGFDQALNAVLNPQDNPEDPPLISRGHNYFNGAFQNDMNNNVSNSCTGDSQGANSSASAGAGGGWSTSGGGVSFVGSGCLGNCGGHGTPTVTKTDLTEEEAKG